MRSAPKSSEKPESDVALQQFELYVQQLAGVTDVLAAETFEWRVVVFAADSDADVRDLQRRLLGRCRPVQHVGHHFRTEDFLETVELIEVLAVIRAPCFDAKHLLDRPRCKRPHNRQFRAETANVGRLVGYLRWACGWRAPSHSGLTETGVCRRRRRPAP